ncbi:MAG: Hsp20/alpha crystallin family protein [Clostridiales bacterium]|nr:Hsp20/alpha crystallin family protein [Clostridiales bacterium]
MMRDITPFRRRRNSIIPGDLIRDFFGRDILDDFFNTGFLTGLSSGVTGIRADIRETDKEYIVEAEMPGFAKEDIEVELVDDRLTISAKRDESVNEERSNFIRRERRYGEVSRTFLLDGVKQEDVKAEYKDGILRIILPKAEEHKRRGRRIDIN